MAGSTLQLSKPMSVKEISAKAVEFEFNQSIPLKYWLRTADTLLREVSFGRKAISKSTPQPIANLVCRRISTNKKTMTSKPTFF
jgi:hypothetical protein